MKTRIMFMAIMVAFTSFATAQEKKGGKKLTPEQRTEFRVRKMQKRLGLDGAEAEKFAPLYKEYLEAKSECRPAVERGRDLTDEQIKSNIEARMDARQKALDVEKKYYKKLSKVLNARQLQKVFGENGPGFGKSGDKKFVPGKKDGKDKTAKKNNGRNSRAHKKHGWKKDGCKNECAKKECGKAECNE